MLVLYEDDTFKKWLWECLIFKSTTYEIRQLAPVTYI